MRKITMFAAALLGAAAPIAANSAVVYSNNFDVGQGVSDFNTTAIVGGGVTATLSGYSIVGTVLNSGYGFSNTFLQNDAGGNPATATVLTLSNLGAHTSVSISMLLAFLDSWDSSDGSVAPDLLNMTVDGVALFASPLTANNTSGTVNNFGTGSTVLGQYVQMDTHQFYTDTVISMANTSELTFAHTGSTLTLAIYASGAGWQGGADESWGIDNLQVSLSGVPTTPSVPEPASWAMMVGGFGLLGGALRRRRATTVVA